VSAPYFVNLLSTPVLTKLLVDFFFSSIQANDDMFFLSSLSTSDFYSPLYGTVIRLDGSLMVRPLFPSKKDDGGEWTALQYANWLLSAFPAPFPHVLLSPIFSQS
jgi:hypothetical protein